MMGIMNPASELSLDFNPTFIPKTITQFLGEVARIGSVCEKISKVDDFVSRLEIELIKIKAFERELPLCMLLMSDAIEALKEESSVFKKSGNQPTLEEFIPLKKTCDDEEPKAESDNGDKSNWLSSTLLWNSNENNLDIKQNNILKEKPVQQVIQKRDDEEQDGMNESPFSGNSRREFIPFKGYFTRNEDKEELPIPGLSLITPGIKNSVRGNGFLTKTGVIQSDVKIGTPQLQPPQQQTSRKQRRCWSTELHRRFLNALQQLGGSKAATPKQIRELMRVDGLTNDEVKSHLQKYRLHTRKFPSSSPSPVPLWTHDQYLESSKYKGFHQSGSPDGPLNRTTTAGTSTTGGDSMDDGEDEKSENNCWKNHPYTSAKDNV